MFELYERIFAKRFEIAFVKNEINAIYTKSNDSIGFYKEALKTAKQKGELKENSTIALGSLQPYLNFYETQFKVIIKELEDEFFANISAIAYGPGQDTLKPEIIAQRLAALIAIVYNNAAKFLLEKTNLTENAIICKDKLMANYKAKNPSNTQSFFKKELSQGQSTNSSCFTTTNEEEKSLANKI